MYVQFVEQLIAFSRDVLEFLRAAAIKAMAHLFIGKALPPLFSMLLCIFGVWALCEHGHAELNEDAALNRTFLLLR